MDTSEHIAPSSLSGEPLNNVDTKTLKEATSENKHGIFIFHDSFSNPEDNWYQSLKSTLSSEKNTEFYIPYFPTPLGQSLESWNIALQPFREKITEDSIFISHGTSSLYAFQLLQSISISVRALILIAPSYTASGNAVMDDLNSSFLKPPIDWQKISTIARETILYTSSNDEFSPIEQVNFIKEKLHATLIHIDEAGHFSKKDGYSSFSELSEQVKKIISTPELTPEERMRKEILKAGYHTTEGSIKNDLSSISTFYDDISKQVTGEEAKALTTLLSDQKESKLKKIEQEKTRFNNALRAIFAIVFITLAVTLVYLYNSSKDTTMRLAQLNNQDTAIIDTGVAKEPVLIDTLSKDQLLDKIKFQLSSKNSSSYFTEVLLSRTMKKKIEKINFINFAKFLESNFDSSLFENINDYHYLFYKADYNNPILILDSKNPTSTLSSLYSWGGNLPSDLASLLNLDYQTTPNQEINILPNEKNNIKYFEVKVSSYQDQNQPANTIAQGSSTDTTQSQTTTNITTSNQDLVSLTTLLYFAPINEHYFIFTKNLTNLIEIAQNSATLNTL